MSPRITLWEGCLSKPGSRLRNFEESESLLVEFGRLWPMDSDRVVGRLLMRGLEAATVLAMVSASSGQKHNGRFRETD